jgi:hypothetical protein
MMKLIAESFALLQVLATERPKLRGSIPAKGYQQVSEAKPMEEAERATPDREARQEKSNGGASAAFAIRMEHKGEERSTKLPLDEEMIRQLAMEAEFKGMRIGALVAALIVGLRGRTCFN